METIRPTQASEKGSAPVLADDNDRTDVDKAQPRLISLMFASEVATLR